jgi:hypothetical protein
MTNYKKCHILFEFKLCSDKYKWKWTHLWSFRLMMFLFVYNFVQILAQILYSLKITKTFNISTLKINYTMTNKNLQLKHQFNCWRLKTFGVSL